MISIGTDIVYIKRLEEKKFSEKIFHQSELHYNNSQKLAGIIAVKEACFKALGVNPRWMEIEVKYKKSGQPYLVFSNELKLKIEDYSCSISHDGEYAVAVVIFHLKR